MKLVDYLSSYGQQIKLASVLGIKPASLSQWSTGLRATPIERCYPIEQATQGKVTRKDLRPDDWHLIWPELAEPPLRRKYADPTTDNRPN